MSAEAFHTHLLRLSGVASFEVGEPVQSLWSGQGQILRYELSGAEHRSVIVKHSAPDRSATHPRGWQTDISYRRKLRSYEVEENWYTQWNVRCGTSVRTPDCFTTYSTGHERWLVLEDLDSSFPIRRQRLDVAEAEVCLTWLARFHALFLGEDPRGLWSIGTYWHLATRPEEWEKMSHARLKAKAKRIDSLLNQCTYKTIVHGDAKLANFCFSEDGQEVAALDFQYVGGGCGMKDVAYFFGSSLSMEDHVAHEAKLLDHYFGQLRSAIQSSAESLIDAAAATRPKVDADAVESEWRSMYPLASADFSRFLLGWMPDHHKVNEYSLSVVEEVLEGLG